MDEKARNEKRRKTEAYRAYQRKYQLAYYHRTKDRETPVEREKRLGYQGAYRQEHKVSRNQQQRIYERQRLYHLTEEQYQAMLTQQEWECLICERMLVKPAVDHDHATGKVRGILCRRCNSAIGLLEDNLDIVQRAADYLLRSLSGATSMMNSEL